MRAMVIGAISASGLVLAACTTHETRIVQQPAAAGTTTVIQSNHAAPVTVESDSPRDIIVRVD